MGDFPRRSKWLSSSGTGLFGCRLDFLFPVVPDLCIVLGHTVTFKPCLSDTIPHFLIHPIYILSVLLPSISITVQLLIQLLLDTFTYCLSEFTSSICQTVCFQSKLFSWVLLFLTFFYSKPRRPFDSAYYLYVQLLFSDRTTAAC